MAQIKEHLPGLKDPLDHGEVVEAGARTDEAVGGVLGVGVHGHEVAAGRDRAERDKLVALAGVVGEEEGFGVLELGLLGACGLEGGGRLEFGLGGEDVLQAVRGVVLERLCLVAARLEVLDELLLEELGGRRAGLVEFRRGGGVLKRGGLVDAQRNEQLQFRVKFEPDGKLFEELLLLSGAKDGSRDLQFLVTIHPGARRGGRAGGVGEDLHLGSK